MKNTIIYREATPDLLKKIKYYKSLSTNHILIDPFDDITDRSIARLTKLAKELLTYDLGLVVEIDIVKITKMLVGDVDQIDWQDPMMRKGLYQFIAYLKKHGLRGFYFRNLEDDFIPFVRELAKNTLDAYTLGIAEIKDPSLLALIQHDFSYLYLSQEPRNNFFDIKEDIKLINGPNSSSYILSTDNSLRDFVNFKNYPFKSHSLVAGISFLLRGAPLVEGLEELGIYNFDASKNDVAMLSKSKKTLDFYQQLFKIRSLYQVINMGSFRLLFDKDPDVLAYMKTYKNEKLIVFANFSQREVLVDIRFHFIDLYDYKYLIGNYGKRTIVKNLLLRPFEFVAFMRVWISRP